MNPYENLQLATRALRVNKLRSALTMLGIVVGVAAVVCMVSVGAGAQAAVSERIRTLGANLLLVMPGALSSGGARLESGTQPTLTEEDAAAIRRQLNVLVAAPLLSRSMPLVAGDRNWMTLVAGINPDYLVAREWQLAAGRSFTDGEIRSAAKVAMVGSIIAEELFEGRVGVGETLRIGNVPFTVIGVLEKKGLGAAGRSQDDVVFIPLPTAKSRVLGAVRGITRDALDFISIKLSDASAIPGAEAEIEALLRQRHRIRGDAPNDFRIENPADVLNVREIFGPGPRHSVDRDSLGFVACRRHQHHEYYAGVGDRTYPRDRFTNGGRRQTPRYSTAILDRSDDFGADWGAHRRLAGSDCRGGDRCSGRLADLDRPMGDRRGVRICRPCGNLVRPLSRPPRRSTRPDRGITLRIARKWICPHLLALLKCFRSGGG